LAVALSGAHGCSVVAHHGHELSAILLHGGIVDRAECRVCGSGVSVTEWAPPRDIALYSLSSRRRSSVPRRREIHRCRRVWLCPRRRLDVPCYRRLRPRVFRYFVSGRHC
jgi:hypothetical protein